MSFQVTFYGELIEATGNFASVLLRLAGVFYFDVVGEVLLTFKSMRACWALEISLLFMSFPDMAV